MQPARPDWRRKRFALVGVGSRSRLYRDALLETYAGECELVGYCDVNSGRLALAGQEAESGYGIRIPQYRDTEFDRMIAETRPDVVIVTTVDAWHHKYIVAAMDQGCDVVTEKPLTITPEACRDILDAKARTGRLCRVAFNYRYSPPRTQVKQLLMDGIIGDVRSVDFHWMLNTRHGADYFRRWHGLRKMSGGLLVHKATHHFDLANWWLSAVPTAVTAMGSKEFYRPETAVRLGLTGPHERCLTCAEKSGCAFQLDLDESESLRTMYRDHEQEDGYWRDRCVFRDEIDIEDIMSVLVRYDTGATMTYSLNAFAAWEGYTIVFNGPKGRLEHRVEDHLYINGDGSVPGRMKDGGVQIRVWPLRQRPYEVPVSTGEGSHGGGDRVLLDDLFGSEPVSDPFLRAADERAGIYSVLTGLAANRSMENGGTVLIDDLVAGLRRPDYPPMPSSASPLPMPPLK